MNGSGKTVNVLAGDYIDACTARGVEHQIPEETDINAVVALEVSTVKAALIPPKKAKAKPKAEPTKTVEPAKPKTVEATKSKEEPKE